MFTWQARHRSDVSLHYRILNIDVEMSETHDIYEGQDTHGGCVDLSSYWCKVSSNKNVWSSPKSTLFYVSLALNKSANISNCLSVALYKMSIIFQISSTGYCFESRTYLELQASLLRDAMTGCGRRSLVTSLRCCEAVHLNIGLIYVRLDICHYFWNTIQ